MTVNKFLLHFYIHYTYHWNQSINFDSKCSPEVENVPPTALVVMAAFRGSVFIHACWTFHVCMLNTGCLHGEAEYGGV